MMIRKGKLSIQVIWVGTSPCEHAYDFAMSGYARVGTLCRVNDERTQVREDLGLRDFNLL